MEEILISEKLFPAVNLECHVSEIKTEISNLVCKKRFWNNLHLVLSKQRYLKLNNLKSLWTRKSKGISKIANIG